MCAENRAGRNEVLYAHLLNEALGDLDDDETDPEYRDAFEGDEMSLCLTL